MSNITEWLKYELYPTLFDRIDTVFTEHQFKSYAGGWRSKTYLDGSPHKDRIDKTVITKKAPGYILEQGGESKSLVDYVMDRDGVEFIEAVKTLASKVGLDLPNSSEFNKEDYITYRQKTTILEDCNTYFTYCLKTSINAGLLLQYLKDRGYDLETIKAMEIGYIPSQKQLKEHLINKGYSIEAIEEVIQFNKAIGDTHSLTIPFRSGGTLKGFKFRAIGTEQPKYLNSTGLDRIGGFFNLMAVKGDKDLVIVEGELDSLHATAKGIENVVATGGSSINSEQVKDAIRLGAKSFTLCFDTEPGKEEDTIKKTVTAINIILKEGINKVYVVSLPGKEDKVDVDSFIRDNGVDRLKEDLKKVQNYFDYFLNELFFKYAKMEQPLTPKLIDNYLEDVVITAHNIIDPIGRSRFIKLFTSDSDIINLGVTEEDITKTVDKLLSYKEREEQAKEFKNLLSKAHNLQDKGDVKGAIDLLQDSLKEVSLKDKVTSFSSLLLPIIEKELMDRQANKPESLRTGLSIEGEELLYPSGAISIISAPTSHGKTSFLINSAINVSLNHPDKEVYLFSYEEDGDSILINTLNTYINDNLSFNNRRSIKSYFSTGSLEHIKADRKQQFIKGKEEFFNGLVSSRRLNINYCNYDSDTLIEAIRYLHKNTNIGAVFIDYIQLLNLPQGKYKTYSRQEEIKEICIALKDIAVETGLPIILGSQFNREVTNHLKIHATKIGEAGDIERIANFILGFWNNEFTPLATDGELSEITRNVWNTPGTLFTTILKNRGGKVGGKDLLLFNGNTGKVSNGSNDISNF